MDENRGLKNRTLIKVLSVKELSSLVMLIIVILIFFSLSRTFLSWDNLSVILETVPELGIAAGGITLLMISGEFDLSVGSVFALAPIVLMMMVDAGVPLIAATVIALLFCCGIGALNGTITLRFGIPSFITTLGMMMVWRGFVLLITGGWPPAFPDKAIPLRQVVVGRIGSIYASLIWYVVLTVVLWAVLERSRFGNWIFATGGNRQAARVLGINIHRVKIINFVIASFMAGLAGIMQGCRLGALVPSAGTGMELDCIASAVIGGTYLMGGVGTVIGTVIGSFLIRVIDNGLVMASAPGYWFRIFIGLITIVAVIINVSVGKRIRKTQ
jgi:simple sugar transport system permease protein